jgi:CHAT domain-containing protein
MAEGDALARLYDAVQLLSGPAATPGALLTHAPRSRIVHVAAHAAVDRDDGRRSRLLLASESGRTGDLYGEQLVQQSWTGVEVVVLAACATAEADGRPTSPMTLASQVLAAGPRYVIATLRPIDDRHASRFFLELHRLLSSGVAAPQALQRAQLQFIDRHPAATLAVWSPIAAFGS